MRNINFFKTRLKELNETEKIITNGGDKFSEDVFYFFGKVFGYLDSLAQIGAPQGNTYKHSG